jgi:allophanate hydrolase
VTARERVTAAYGRIAELDRPEVWITLRAPEDALADADAVDARVAAGAELPLAGATLAVKDNIDVAGLPTTAGCPSYAYEPAASAPAVTRLVAAGAVVLGKTNLDQFATGLVGTRSPYGAVRDARRLDWVAGGSSSGSAVAVALGMADLALGTDTAGSGRVPAAFQGVVGIKPTRGLVSTLGVVPACRSLDCVTVFARDLAAGRQAMWVMAGTHPADPLSRGWPVDAALAARPAARVGVPGPGQLAALTAEGRLAFGEAGDALAEAGVELVEVDIQPLLDAGRMLYEGAFVAERHAAVGAFVEAHRDAVDPVVGAIIAAAGAFSASRLVADGERLDALRLAARAALAGTDAVLLPTVPCQPTIAAVAADPVAVNSRLGLYTNCCNLLDLCAIAIPAGEADGGQFGVTLAGPAFADCVVADLAGALLGDTVASASAARPAGVELLVVGAHRRGQPLNSELTGRGARYLATVKTTAEYRLSRLDTDPPKPGLARVSAGGVQVEGELWALPPTGLADLLATLPTPMALGRVLLEDRRGVVGFLCEPIALRDAEDISAHGSWPAFLRARAEAGSAAA